MNSTLSWLHLSDFHVGKDNYGQRQLFDQLLTHVEGRLAAVPDLVVLSGDIANHGKIEEYDDFSNQFLFPLSEILGPRVRIYSVPGNHDVDRSRARVVQFAGILKQSPTLLDPSTEGLNDRSTLLPRFRNYIAGDLLNVSENHWLQSEAACFTDQFAAGEHQVCVIGVNTAWLCHGDDDRHCLSAGKPIIENALKTAKKAELKLLIGHHPVDWFLDEEIEPISALFVREGVTYLHGHLHRSRSKYEGHGAGNFLAIQSGAAFQARESEEWINRILWAQADFSQREIRIEPFQWSRQHQEWVIDSSSFHSKIRRQGTDFWVLPMPEERSAPKPKPLHPSSSEHGKAIGLGWIRLECAGLNASIQKSDPSRILAYFDGRSPSWAEALDAGVPRRTLVEELKSRLEADADREQPSVIVLLGAGGEGKSTAIRQIAGDLCLHTSRWKVIWHEDVDTALKFDFIRPLRKEADSRWLIVSDDAELIARDVYNVTKHLHETGRRDIHFLLSARDTDWLSVEADQLAWRLYMPLVETRLRGLSAKDARLIVEAWASYGDRGLGRLAGCTVDDAVAKLVDSSRLEESSEGAFLGAMLRTRVGEDLKAHVEALLQRLRQRSCPMGTLADAFAYIAALHSENLLVLNRDVLAEALGCKPGELRRFVLGPLGEEAAVGSVGTCILTRHRAIAETAVERLSQRMDFDQVFLELMLAAVKVFLEGCSVPHLRKYEFLSTHFFEKGDPERAVRLANALVKRYPHKPQYITNLAHLYRQTGQLPSAVALFRQTLAKCERDQIFFQNWATVEAESGNLACSAYLHWFALSDVGVYEPIKNDRARTGLIGIVAALRGLSEQYNDARLACGSNCGAFLCRRLNLDDKTKRRLAEIQPTVSATDIPTEYNNSLAMMTLASGAQAAWEYMERRLPDWVQEPSQVTMVWLSRLLACTPPPKAQAKTSR